ncbi:MAG: 50S ribosomal protein L29 [Candidatus Daviesbacteria bacterium]|nr:50S ribosomal protein L29 [Candidatus Daviesbacteria bacterium]
MKKNELAENKRMDKKSLLEKIKKAKQEIWSLYMDKNMAKLANFRVIKNKRREVAQLMTILNQKISLEKLEVKQSFPPAEVNNG